MCIGNCDGNCGLVLSTYLQYVLILVYKYSYLGGSTAITQSCKFRQWGGWWPQLRGWRRCWEKQAERRWRTRLGNGHNLQNGTALHAQFSATADEPWRIDATWMWHHSQQLLQDIWEVRGGWIEGSGSRLGTKGRWFHRFCTHNIGAAYGDFWYHRRQIGNAAKDLSIGKYSDDARFPESTVRQMHGISPTSCSTWLVPDEEINGCWTHKLLPLHIASPAYFHIEIRFGWRNGDGSCITCGANRWIDIFDDAYLGNDVSVSILLRAIFCLISVTKLWDMIMHLCMWKGGVGHAKFLDSKYHWLTSNELDII